MTVPVFSEDKHLPFCFFVQAKSVNIFHILNPERSQVEFIERQNLLSAFAEVV